MNSNQQNIDINKFIENLYFKNGIWFSRESEKISYPEQGNEICYEIEESSFWFKHRNNCILASIKNHPPNGTIFDIGGGNGYVAKFLQDNGYNVVLIEPGIIGASNALKRGLYHVVCSTFENAGINENSLPAVGLFDVLEHIQDDQHFISLIRKKMTLSGKLYLTVPAYNWLWSHEDDLSGHYRRYTLDVLRNLLSRSGFGILYSTYFFSPLPLAIYIFRTLPSKFKQKKHQIITEQFKSEHKSSNKLINCFWNLEYRYIKNRLKISFGGSCLVVAYKK